MAQATAGAGMNEKMKWGVLGTGHITRKLIEAIQKSSNAQVTMIGGRNAEKARALADEYNIARAGNFDDLLNDGEVLAIYNATPNGLHAEWTIKACAAKKHTLCEKPMSLLPAEVEAIFDAARENGVLVMEAFMYRFHPQWQRVAEVLASGRIGRVRHLRAIFSFFSGDFSNIRFSRELQGGALADVGCYCVNFARTVAAMCDPHSQPVAVSAMAQWQGYPNNVDEILSGALRFSDGVTAEIFCGLRANAGGFAEIFGEKGKLEIPNPWFGGETGSLVVHAEGETETLEFAGANNYILEVEHFSRAIAGGEELFLSPDDALANARVLDALLRSAREGREIEVSRNSINNS